MALAGDAAIPPSVTGSQRAVVHDEESPFIGNGAERKDNGKSGIWEEQPTGPGQELGLGTNGGTTMPVVNGSKSTIERSITPGNDGASSGDASATMNNTSARGRGRPRKNVKVTAASQKDEQAFRVKRAASPVSSLDGTIKLRRNAPRLTVNASVRKPDDPSIFEDPIPEVNMLPPSSPPPQAVVSDPALAPLQPYDASPRSIFRPPPSAALQIFNKPPSPSFRLAFRGQKLADIPASGSGSFPASAAGGNSAMSNYWGAETPLTAVSSSLHPSTAEYEQPEAESSRNGVRASTPQMGTVIRATRGSLVSGDTSPYAIKKTIVKTAVRKGKAKQGVAGFSQETVPNNDFCSACGGIGRFLCCDGCPRSFHFMCLEPPLDVDQLPEEDEWFCKQCTLKRIPKSLRVTSGGLFGPLMNYIDKTNPQEFKLTDDIRNTFTNIQTGSYGGYLENHEEKPVKFDRSGFPEEKDLYKLKSKGKPVTCFRCKGSAAPIGPGVAAGVAVGRRMLSCDYCSLHWHLDCLDPPPPTMPHPVRKWMCPNHAQSLLPKKRTLKGGMKEELVTRPGTKNNGLIEILDPEGERKRIEYENAYINGKRYKVPERIIHLDFWSKIGKPIDSASMEGKHSAESIFGGQSPLSTAPSSPASDKDEALHQNDLDEMTDSELAPAIRGLLGLTEAWHRSRANDTGIKADSSSAVVDSLDNTAEGDREQSVPRFAQSSRPTTSSPPPWEAATGIDGAVDEPAADLVASPPRKEAQIDRPIQAQPMVLTPVDDEMSLIFPNDCGVGANLLHDEADAPWLDTNMTLQDILAAGESTPEPVTSVAASSPVPPTRPESTVSPSLTQHPTVAQKSLTQNPVPVSNSATQRSAPIATRPRRLAPAQPNKLPAPILQPSENVTRVKDGSVLPSPHGKNTNIVTPAKRTISQAALSSSPNTRGPVRQRFLPPTYTPDPPATAVGPLQAYANPDPDRMVSVSGSPSPMKSQSIPSKITLKLPGQSQLSARMASAKSDTPHGHDGIAPYPT